MSAFDTGREYQAVSGWFQRKENEYSFPDILHKEG
jgi:hypothetical protein